MRLVVFGIVIGMSVAGCARSSVIPMSADTFQITTGAAPCAAWLAHNP